ncbi:hypothetical protein GCM10009691_37200 [Brevibacterium picturae]|uniref:Uncharacterized protein n=1 Tax=Brevibacterium picturae TaxID=260553 RepID=A0ABN2CJK4_9MICO
MAVSCDIPRQLAGAHRESDQDDIAKIECLEHCVEVRRECVVVIAAADLAGLAETASIIRDDSEAGGEQFTRLPLPAVPIKWIAVDQYNRLP